MKPLIEPLTPAERSDYLRLKTVARQCVGAALQWWSALDEIRSRRLYREEFKTFDKFLESLWKLLPDGAPHRSRAYQMMQAARINDDLSEIVDKGEAPAPKAESQVRPLGRLKTKEARREAWKEAAEVAGGTPTAEVVSGVVDDIIDNLNLPPDPLEEHQREAAARKEAADRVSPPRDDRTRRLRKILHYGRQIKRCARGLGGEGEDMEGLADKILAMAEDRLAT